jgi:hypothetical protein
MNWIDDWQKFEAEYDISNKYPKASQIIYMAFEAGHKSGSEALEIAEVKGRLKLVEELLTPRYGAKVLEVDGDYLRRLKQTLENKLKELES